MGEPTLCPLRFGMPAVDLCTGTEWHLAAVTEFCDANGKRRAALRFGLPARFISNEHAAGENKKRGGG